MFTLPVLNIEGKEIDTIKLDESVFDGAINKEAVYQAVNVYRANQRRGMAATKTRGEVSGGGKKPWKQKGTGRARVGSTRSPLWRHGGVIFGPHPRDFSYTIPSKIKTLALKSCLNAKVKENSLIVVDNLSVDKPKSKDALNILANLKVKPARATKKAMVLLILNNINENLKKACRNIAYLSVNLPSDTFAYEVLTHKKLIITKEGLKDLTSRLKK